MFGNTCGIDNTKNPNIPKAVAYNLEKKKYLYWPYPLDFDIQLCVEECPKKTSGSGKENQD